MDNQIRNEKNTMYLSFASPLYKQNVLNTKEEMHDAELSLPATKLGEFREVDGKASIVVYFPGSALQLAVLALQQTWLMSYGIFRTHI